MSIKISPAMLYRSNQRAREATKASREEAQQNFIATTHMSNEEIEPMLETLSDEQIQALLEIANDRR